LGILEAREVAKQMHAQHKTEFDEDEFQEYFKATDLNADGKLSWDEWYK